jgi:hypothetical protein
MLRNLCGAVVSLTSAHVEAVDAARSAVLPPQLRL